MTDNILILLSVAFLLFAVISIPFLLQIWRTARDMDETLQLLNQRLPLIMKNLEEITTNINRTSTAVHREVADLAFTLRRIQGIVGVFFGLEEVLRRRMRFPFMRTFRTSVAVARGARVFIDCLKGGGQGKGGSSSSAALIGQERRNQTTGVRKG